MPKLLHNAIIINEGRRFKGWLSINNEGRIEAVGEGTPPSDVAQKEGVEIRNVRGRWLMPGVIDSHVHFREPGLTHKATILTESRAAAAGGITSFMEMPNTNPATTTQAALREKQMIASRNSVVNYAFFIGATNDNLDELKQTDFTRVPGIKLFMGSSTGGMLVDGEKALEQIFKLPGVIMAHCEDEAIIRENMARVERLYPDDDAPVALHADIRSTLACLASTRRGLELARKHGARLHVAHLTTAEELALFEAGDNRATAEVCVAHLLFCDEDYAALGTGIKCNPSVKSSRHRLALRKALNDGRIMTVSTDHAPHTRAEKANGTITAPSGMPMIQFSLPAMIDLTHEGVLTPERMVELMCHNQATLFGVKDRGFLRPGYWADIVEVDPDEMTDVNADAILSSCGWSPLEGRSLKGRVMRTLVNGQTVYNAGNTEPFTRMAAAQPLVFNNAFGSESE